MTEKIRRNRFAANFKALRVQAGLNQLALARLLGIAQPAVARYESGIREPDLDDLMAIAEKLNTTPNDLLGFPSASSAPSAGGDTTHGANSPIIKVNGNHNTIAPPSTSTSPSTPKKRKAKK